jgi:hypothetical protein
VHDDALKPRQEPEPEVALRRGAPRQQVVRGEDRGRAQAQQAIVELRRREPLHVHDVSRTTTEPGQAHGVLEELDRDAQP